MEVGTWLGYRVCSSFRLVFQLLAFGQSIGKIMLQA